MDFKLFNQTNSYGLHLFSCLSNTGLAILYCLCSKTLAQANSVPNLIPKNSELIADNQAAVDSSVEFTILPLGINVGGKNVLPSVLIRGYENGSEAVDFENWLISFDDVAMALQLEVTPLDDGLLEIRSPGLVVKIDPQELSSDPDIGRTISVKQIIEYFGVKTEFDIAEYAVNFIPSWTDGKDSKNQVSSKFLPVVTEGLPLVKAPAFSLSAVGERISFSHSKNSETKETQIGTRGEVTALGTILGNSWYLNIDQNEITNPKSWQINQFQLLRQKPNADYILGSQSTFWENQSDGDYWGLTTIQRWGFSLPLAVSGNFNVEKRLQTSNIGVEIVGEAEPGTIVQLRQNLSAELLGEVLVDSSGVYRFENIDTSKVRSKEFKVFLYPNGQLTAEPEIRDADFSIVPGQLIKGASALVASVGINREKEGLLGNFTDYQGGLSYRRGVTKDLTMGTGIVLDKTILGVAEVFYQPNNFPLTVAASSLIGTENGIEFNADIRYKPSTNLRFHLRADETSQRATVNWQAFPSLNLNAGTNLSEGTFNTGASFYFGQRNFSNSINVGFDSTENNLSWGFRSRLNSLELSHRGSSRNLNTNLKYQISSAHSLSLNYNKQLSADEFSNLAVVNWSYRPKFSNSSRRKSLRLDLGYGIGSEGHGLIASATTNVLPGIDIRASYRQISSSSDNDVFSLQISPSLSVQPKLGMGDGSMNGLRSKGGLLIQPFLDNNGNGKLDSDEEIYTEEIDLLLMLNNRPVRKSQARIKGNGVLFQVNPNKYRVDLDPAGYPIDYTPVKTAYAVDVAPGGYTVLPIPFAVSYTVAGTATDAENKPIGGATIEAVATKETAKKTLSVTNGSGVFYLENLQQGTYELFINGQPAQPSTITIDENTESFSEINLQL